MRIAVDAMGGDHAPAAGVQGAADAAREYGIDVSIVGRADRSAAPARLASEAAASCPCTQVIGWTSIPARPFAPSPTPRCASARACAEEGRADGWISAGNSGAVMAAALFIQGRIKGVDRPALGSIVPTAGRLRLLPRRRRQRGREARVPRAVRRRWARSTRARCSAAPTPRVGLLSNGEEEGKGDERVKETAAPAAEAACAASSATSSRRTSTRRGRTSSSPTASSATSRSRWPRPPRTSSSATCATRSPRRCAARLGGLLIRPGVRQHPRPDRLAGVRRSAAARHRRRRGRRPRPLRRAGDQERHPGRARRGARISSSVRFGQRWEKSMTRTAGRGVVVTGMGTVNPLGKNLEEYWDGLIEGRSTAPRGRGLSDREADHQVRLRGAQLRPAGLHGPQASRSAWRGSRSWRSRPPRWRSPTPGSTSTKEDSFRVGVDMGTGIGGFVEMTQGAHLLRDARAG